MKQISNTHALKQIEEGNIRPAIDYFVEKAKASEEKFYNMLEQSKSMKIPQVYSQVVPALICLELENTIQLYRHAAVLANLDDKSEGDRYLAEVLRIEGLIIQFRPQ